MAISRHHIVNRLSDGSKKRRENEHKECRHQRTMVKVDRLWPQQSDQHDEVSEWIAQSHNLERREPRIFLFFRYDIEPLAKRIRGNSMEIACLLKGVPGEQSFKIQSLHQAPRARAHGAV